MEEEALAEEEGNRALPVGDELEHKRQQRWKFRAEQRRCGAD